MERIKDGLIACIAVKPFAKVSVSDISAASGVTRATFYRIFDTTTDVMSFICDDLFLKASRELRRSEDSDEERIIRLFTFLTENADSIDAGPTSSRAVSTGISNCIPSISPESIPLRTGNITSEP